jgi:hypothetical protein
VNTAYCNGRDAREDPDEEGDGQEANLNPVHVVGRSYGGAALKRNVRDRDSKVGGREGQKQTYESGLKCYHCNGLPTKSNGMFWVEIGKNVPKQGQTQTYEYGLLILRSLNKKLGGSS